MPGVLSAFPTVSSLLTLTSQQKAAYALHGLAQAKLWLQSS